jgi:hypothetical protein
LTSGTCRANVEEKILGMASFSESRVVVRSAIFGALGLAVVLAIVLWATRRDEWAAQRAAHPDCISRTGSEAACEAHLDQYHRECFNLTFDRGGRGRASSFDQAGYTACVVDTPKVWLEKKRVEKAAHARESSTQP